MMHLLPIIAALSKSSDLFLATKFDPLYEGEKSEGYLKNHRIETTAETFGDLSLLTLNVSPDIPTDIDGIIELIDTIHPTFFGLQGVREELLEGLIPRLEGHYGIINEDEYSRDAVSGDKMYVPIIFDKKLVKINRSGYFRTAAKPSQIYASFAEVVDLRFGDKPAYLVINGDLYSSFADVVSAMFFNITADIAEANLDQKPVIFLGNLGIVPSDVGRVMEIAYKNILNDDENNKKLPRTTDHSKGNDDDIQRDFILIRDPESEFVINYARILRLFEKSSKYPVNAILTFTKNLKMAADMKSKAQKEDSEFADKLIEQRLAERNEEILEGTITEAEIREEVREEVRKRREEKEKVEEEKEENLLMEQIEEENRLSEEIIGQESYTSSESERSSENSKNDYIANSESGGTNSSSEKGSSSEDLEFLKNRKKSNSSIEDKESDTTQASETNPSGQKEKSVKTEKSQDESDNKKNAAKKASSASIRNSEGEDGVTDSNKKQKADGKSQLSQKTSTGLREKIQSVFGGKAAEKSYLIGKSRSSSESSDSLSSSGSSSSSSSGELSVPDVDGNYMDIDTGAPISLVDPADPENVDDHEADSANDLTDGESGADSKKTGDGGNINAESSGSSDPKLSENTSEDYQGTDRGDGKSQRDDGTDDDAKKNEDDSNKGEKGKEGSNEEKKDLQESEKRSSNEKIPSIFDLGVTEVPIEGGQVVKTDPLTRKVVHDQVDINAWKDLKIKEENEKMKEVLRKTGAEECNIKDVPILDDKALKPVEIHPIINKIVEADKQKTAAEIKEKNKKILADVKKNNIEVEEKLKKRALLNAKLLQESVCNYKKTTKPLEDYYKMIKLQNELERLKKQKDCILNLPKVSSQSITAATNQSTSTGMASSQHSQDPYPAQPQICMAENALNQNNTAYPLKEVQTQPVKTEPNSTAANSGIPSPQKTSIVYTAPNQSVSTMLRPIITNSSPPVIKSAQQPSTQVNVLSPTFNTSSALPSQRMGCSCKKLDGTTLNFPWPSGLPALSNQSKDKETPTLGKSVAISSPSTPSNTNIPSPSTPTSTPGTSTPLPVISSTNTSYIGASRNFNPIQPLPKILPSNTANPSQETQDTQRCTCFFQEHPETKTNILMNSQNTVNATSSPTETKNIGILASKPDDKGQNSTASKSITKGTSSPSVTTSEIMMKPTTISIKNDKKNPNFIEPKDCTCFSKRSDTIAVSNDKFEKQKNKSKDQENMGVSVKTEHSSEKNEKTTELPLQNPESIADIMKGHIEVTNNCDQNKVKSKISESEPSIVSTARKISNDPNGPIKTTFISNPGKPLIIRDTYAPKIIKNPENPKQVCESSHEILEAQRMNAELSKKAQHVAQLDLKKPIDSISCEEAEKIVQRASCDLVKTLKQEKKETSEESSNTVKNVKKFKVPGGSITPKVTGQQHLKISDLLGH